MTLNNSDKTEKATPKKKEDERKKGNVFQSKDFTSVLTLLALFSALKILGPYFFEFIANYLKKTINSFAEISEISSIGAAKYLSEFALNVALFTIPLGLLASLVALISTMAQTKLLVNFKNLKPKFSRLNPISGIKKMFTLRSIITLLKSCIYIIIVAAIIYNEITGRLHVITNMINFSIEQSIYWICETIYSIVVSITIFMLGLGVFDFLYQWWEYSKQIRMSKQEIKEEYKQTEGNPETKSKIKERQRAAAARRMMAQVPFADVVIKNPTHFAVAIKYDPKKNRAPIVIAKGMDFLALKIIEIAEQNNVSINENPPLARGLYAAVEIDQEIPEEFYKAVADILAFFYNIKKRKPL